MINDSAWRSTTTTTTGAGTTWQGVSMSEHVGKDSL